MDFTILALLGGGERQALSPAIEESGSSLRLTISRESIPAGTIQLDVRSDALRAQVGEEGYIACSGPTSCGDFLCEFMPREEDEWAFRVPLLPLFGIKKRDFCVACMVTSGNLELAPVISVKDGFYEVSARFELEMPAYEDIIIECRLLSGKDADYSGMARAYRVLRLKTGAVRPLSERMADSPELRHAAETIYVRIRQGWKPVPSPVPEQTIENEPPMRVAVTFDRAAELMDEFKRQGIADADFCLVGWNQKGHDGRYPQLFPVEEALGGEERLRALIDHAHDLGFSINCHTNSTDAYRIAEGFCEDDIIRKKDGQLSQNNEGWSAGNMYHLCAQAGLRLAKNDLPKVADLGFHGLHYIDVISVVWPRACFNKTHLMTRRQTADAWLDIMRLAKRLFGALASEGCFDFATPALDFGLYQDFNLLGALPEIATRRIPLWSLVYHGIILSNPSAETVNYAVKGWRERLKCHEYGGRPALYYYSKFVGEGRSNWMGENKDLLCGTEEELKGSVAAVRAVYDDYEQLKHLQTLFMEKHEVLNEQVTCVTYSSGERLVCNYTGTDYVLDGAIVPARDMRLLHA